MWDPKLEAPGNQSSSSTQQNKKLDYQDNSQVDSGFLSSEQILQSFSEDAPVPTEERPDESLDSGASLDLKTVETSTYLDSGLVEDFPSGSDMLLEKDVDTGLAEWLCHSLNLKKNNTCCAEPQINNLSTVSRKLESSASVPSMDQKNISEVPVDQQEEQQQHLEMPEEEQPWERCYKQDADGET